MDFDLSPDHELIRRTVREFAEGEVAPVAEELDRTKTFPYEIVEKLGKLNLMGIPFPQEYGGGGGDTLAYALAVEELTRVDSSVAITLCAHTSLGTQPVYLFGCEEQKREWLPRLCSGERLGAFGLTEPEAGSDAGNTRTRARLEDGEWVIDGAKQFITNAGTDISGIVCITAVTGEHGATARSSASGRPQGDLEPDRPQRHAGLRAGRALPEDGLERLGHAPADVQRLPRARGEPARSARRRASSSSCTSSTSGASAWPRWASAWPRARSIRRCSTPRSAGRSASRSRSSRRSRASSPTCRPRSRRRACSSTRPRSRRTPSATSR